jgi:hypothetical protein
MAESGVNFHMALTEHQKRWHARRRADLRKRGMCEDCGKKPAKNGVAPSRQNKPHRCCENCLQARRDRAGLGGMPPLFRAIEKTERGTG